jgi:hypothetical protein
MFVTIMLKIVLLHDNSIKYQLMFHKSRTFKHVLKQVENFISVGV